uniref:Uncharacterized protein n=1 Tax=uncultured verrucomicrobium HF0500_18J03 TaxID=723599 RepID=E7C5A6_9BACT|nr:hypothetical protein [uncultured verrucomicrobium HF0500_18J03]
MQVVADGQETAKAEEGPDHGSWRGRIVVWQGPANGEEDHGRGVNGRRPSSGGEPVGGGQGEPGPSGRGENHIDCMASGREGAGVKRDGELGSRV